MEITKRKTMTGSRYLSFVLNKEEYCIEILKIREIMGITEITAIPQTPPFIKGVINLRGRIIPIIDLRLKFDMEERPYTDRTCIIVVEIEYEGETTLMGVVVDSIQEVINIPEDKVTDVPYINAKVKSDYIRGIAETGKTVKIILDITKVLTEEDFVMIRDLGSGENESGNPPDDGAVAGKKKTKGDSRS